MAQTIKQIATGSKPKLAIKRIKYSFEEKIAKEKWMDIYKKHVGNVYVGKDAKAAWNSLILWAMGHDCSIDLTKGIGLVGRTGSGKTIAMHVLNDFIGIDTIKYKRGNDIVNLRYKLISAIVIAGDYSQSGYDALYKYSKFANLCIDDLGAENTNKKHFGDAANVIQELIELRYNNRFMTHFTSNLTTEMIQQVYGDRVYSRLIGSVNIIKMNDQDYRTFNK